MVVISGIVVSQVGGGEGSPLETDGDRRNLEEREQEIGLLRHIPNTFKSF